MDDERQQEVQDALRGRVERATAARDDMRDMVALGYGRWSLRGPAAIVLLALLVVVVGYAGSYALGQIQAQHADNHQQMQRSHLAIIRQTQGVREETRLLGCVMTITPEERGQLRRLVAMPGTKVRMAMRVFCPWLDESEDTGYGDGAPESRPSR